MNRLPSIDANGTIHYAPAIVVPYSPLASSEARAAFADRTPRVPPDYFHGDPFAPERIAKTRAWFADGIRAATAHLPETLAIDISSATIGGVAAQIVTPKAGERNADRVLVNLHGGGFVFGTELGLVEAMPVASAGHIKVVTVDYRMAPEHRFPAASEDVAKVYAALLETYRPENIGIYGCSAGGTLTMQAVAWFRAHGLPRPGAIATACAGGIASPTAFPPGDSQFASRLLTGAPMPTPGAPTPASLMHYFANEDLKSRLASPALYPDILAAFPPSLFVSGTRDFALSGAVWTHNQIVKQRIDAALHVWEGMGHDLLYLDTPETREAHDVIAGFFETRLGRAGAERT